MKKIRYDIEQLRMAVPIQDVIEEYTGNKPNQSGMIECPNPEHLDNNPSAKCYEDSNSCHCFTCGQSFSPMDIIMMNENVSFPEACKMLIDDFGLNIYHYSNLEEIGRELSDLKTKEYFEVFPIDFQEMKLLGFAPTSYTGIINQTEYIHDPFGVSETVKRQFHVPTLKELWNKPQNREWVERMILQKAEQALEERAMQREEIKEKVIQYKTRNTQTDYLLASAYIHQLELEWEQSGEVDEKREESFQQLGELEKEIQKRGTSVFQYLDVTHPNEKIIEYQFLRIWHEDLMILKMEEEKMQSIILKVRALQKTRKK